MRVTFALSYEKTIRNINRKQADVDGLSTNVATGRRLLKPSDDPVAWFQAMDLKQGLKEFEAIQKNIDFARGWNQVTENALNQLSDLFVNAKNNAIGAMSDITEEERNARVNSLDQMIREAVNLANGEYHDRYLFSVNSAAPPFTMGDSPTSVAGPTPLSSLSDKLQVRVASGRHERVNVDGAAVFVLNVDGQQTNSLQQLVVLRDAIRNNDPEAISKQLGIIDSILEKFSDQSTAVGARLAGLDRQQEALNSIKLEHQTLLSEVEDADMVEVFTQLQLKQTAFEAALRVTGMLTDLNLSNYL